MSVHTLSLPPGRRPYGLFTHLNLVHVGRGSWWAAGKRERDDGGKQGQRERVGGRWMVDTEPGYWGPQLTWSSGTVLSAMLGLKDVAG